MTNPTLHIGGLFACLMKLSQLRREPVDALQLQSLLRDSAITSESQPRQIEAVLQDLAHSMRWPKPQAANKPDPARLPCLILAPEQPAGLIVAASKTSWTMLH